MYTSNHNKFINRQHLSKRKYINTTGFRNNCCIDAINTSTDALKEEVILQQREIRKIKTILFPTTWVILFVVLFLSLSAYPATLVPLKVKCEQGQGEIILPIDLKIEPAERISGIQFDIVIPPGTKITNMSVAESAQKANKMVSYNQIKTNTYRTIVAGLNQQTISEGTILFVNISIEDSSLTGKQIVKLLNTVLADPEGNSVNCVVLPGEILFPGSESSSEKEAKTPSTPSKEETSILDFKKVGLIILVSVVIILVGGVIAKKIVSNKKSNVVSKKQSKKHKK